MIRMNAAKRGLAWLIALPLLCACSQAQLASPQPGQPGKDVIWLPSPPAMVERMLDLAAVTPQDRVVDLGSGDGRTVLAAARRGARALGVEFDPGLVELSRRNAERAGLAGKASFMQGDLFEADLSDATVVTLFLLTHINMKLRPTLLALKPGTRIVSSTFRMGEWLPDAQASTGCESSFCTAYLWVVPANVEGYWDTGSGELAITQDFQRLYGTLTEGEKRMPIDKGDVRGNEIRFSAGGADYAATLQGNAMEGTSSVAGVRSRWSAVRRRL